jgi:hypothetical protein
METKQITDASSHGKKMRTHPGKTQHITDHSSRQGKKTMKRAAKHKMTGKRL